MSSISEVVGVSISVNSVGLTRDGFGTPLLMAYHTNFGTDEVRRYTDLASLVADGFTSGTPVYRMAQAIFSQNPKVAAVKVGRVASATAQQIVGTVTTATEGDVISFNLVSPAGVSTAISRTVPGSSSLAAEGDAVAALVNAISGLSGTGNTDGTFDIDVDTAGNRWYIDSAVNVTFNDTTGDGGYDSSLTTAEDVDSDFYAVLIDSNSEVNIEDVAAWVETRRKIFVAQSYDNDEIANVTGTGDDLATSAYTRTALIFTDDPKDQIDAAAVGKQLPKDPGSSTWFGKTLAGVSPVDITSTQKGYLDTANSNYYTTIAGVNLLRPGTMADGGFIDTIRGTDWLTSEMESEIFLALITAEKVPYTQAGLDVIRGAMLAVLQRAVQRGLISDDYTVEIPDISTISSANKTARLLEDVKFSATLQGAIHSVTIVGTLTA